ncbi:MAG: hypothetical protein IIA58_02970 [Candidatus Marinimicrobia bacterium]|nr:hypothetical protein [Candidatus Neomarinimicrobiota bacterium]
MHSALIAAESEDNKAAVIRNIIFVRQNVFSKDDNPLGLGDPYLNRLHFITRKRIIKQELLFKVGDIFDQDLINETERNLRKLIFIGSVKIAADKNPDGSVDLTVYTRDLWTTVIGIEFSRVNSENVYGLILEEQSLLGYGSPLSFGFTNTVDGNRLKLSNLYKRIRGTRWNLNTFLRDGPDEEYRYFYALNRPLYSLNTKWALDAQINNQNLPRKKDTDEEFIEQSNSQFYSVTRVYGTRFRKLVSSIDFFREKAESEKLFQNISELTGKISFRSLRFAKAVRLDKMERVEDLELGSSIGFGLSKAGSFINSDRDYWKISANQTLSFPSGSRSWILQRFRYTNTFENDEDVNSVWEFGIKAYSQIFPNHTIAFRLFAGSRSNLDERTDIYSLRDRTGLRGYTSGDSLSGRKILLMNLEDRIFSDIKLLTLSFGGVIFADAGGIWEESESFNLSELNYSIGFGFRWEISKSASSRVTKLDFALPLNGKGLSIDNIVVLISSGQLFSK